MVTTGTPNNGTPNNVTPNDVTPRVAPTDTPAVTPAVTPEATPEITPPITPAITPMSRTHWWAYLIASLLLAAFAVGRPLWRGWSAYAETHPVKPIAVAAGQDAQYAGAQWRLVASSEETRSANAVTMRRLRPGTALFRARFTLIPSQGMDLKLLSRCRLQVRDRAGRRWNAYGARIGTLPNSCGSGYDAQHRQITPKVGEPWTFEVGFVVPEDVVREVEPEIYLPPALPNFLRFSRRSVIS
jgi:hypothetical protein